MTYVYSYILLTLLPPIVFFLLFIQNRNYFSFNWFAWLAAFLLVYIFIFQCGAWPYVGYYFRYILFLLFVFFYWLILRKKRTKKKKNTIIGGIFAVIFCIIFLLGNIDVYKSTHIQDAGIELSFPLQNGKYVIQQGGDSKITNAAHRSRIEYSFACDIIKLNEAERRGDKIFSEDLKDYAIYGDTVVSPCDCKVISVRNGIEENIPPFMNTIERGGNFVILQQDDIRIILCHLQKNSIQVKEGQKLKTGTPLGLVGNTGFSIEPHLHLQAYKKSIRGRDQVPIRFDGIILKLNDVIVSEQISN